MGFAPYSNAIDGPKLRLNLNAILNNLDDIHLTLIQDSSLSYSTERHLTRVSLSLLFQDLKQTPCHGAGYENVHGV